MKQLVSVTMAHEAAAMRLAGYDVRKNPEGGYLVDFDGRIVLERYREHVRDLA
jgi:hypothetical protein